MPTGWFIWERPASSKADPSVVAVAETLAEMGRRYEDDSILNKAIVEYKFLRREYPGSKYRADGLFTVAEIYKDDLNDSQSGPRFLRRVSCATILTTGWRTTPVRPFWRSISKRWARRTAPTS